MVDALLSIALGVRLRIVGLSGAADDPRVYVPLFPQQSAVRLRAIVQLALS